MRVSGHVKHTDDGTASPLNHVRQSTLSPESVRVTGAGCHLATRVLKHRRSSIIMKQEYENPASLNRRVTRAGGLLCQFGVFWDGHYWRTT
jgi:hypothetical protein